MNAAIEQLSDPKYTTGSTLRLAADVIPAKLIKELPFRDETDAITISLDEHDRPEKLAPPLQVEALAPEREAYQKAVDDALAEDKDGGSLKPETVARVRDAVARLYAKTNELIPKTKQPDHVQAMNYLKGLAGLSRMLEKPNVESVLSELEKIENTTVGNLIAFMHSYNLRFAAPQNAKQRAAYRTIYPCSPRRGIRSSASQAIGPRPIITTPTLPRLLRLPSRRRSSTGWVTPTSTHARRRPPSPDRQFRKSDQTTPIEPGSSCRFRDDWWRAIDLSRLQSLRSFPVQAGQAFPAASNRSG